MSFLKDVAPILVQNCIACHNPRKSESKYTMTTFAQLAKGGVRGKGVTLVGGDADGSYFHRACAGLMARPSDALQARSAGQGEAGGSRTVGQGRGEVRRLDLRPRTGPLLSARPRR